MNASKVVAYQDLEPDAQRVFKQALTQGEIDGVTKVADSAMQPLVENPYVRYNGRLYRVRAQPQLTPRTVLLDVTRVNQSAIRTQSTVVAYSNLSAEGKEAFKTVLSGNESNLYYHPDRFPLPGDPLDNNSTYIKYQHEYYELSLAHADNWSYYVSVTNTSQH